MYTHLQISLELFKINSKVSTYKHVYLHIFALNVAIQTFTLTTSLMQIIQWVCGKIPCRITFKQRPCTSYHPKERLPTLRFLLTNVYTLYHTDLQSTASICTCFLNVNIIHIILVQTFCIIVYEFVVNFEIYY